MSRHPVPAGLRNRAKLPAGVTRSLGLQPTIPGLPEGARVGPEPLVLGRARPQAPPQETEDRTTGGKKSIPRALAGLATRLSNVFLPGGGDLSPDEARAGRSAGLISFGTSMLKAQEPRPQGTRSFAADLGSAIEAGQLGAQEGLERRSEAQDLASGRRSAEILSTFAERDLTNPAVLQELFATLLSQREFEGAKSVAEVLKTMQGGGGSFRVQAGIGPDGSAAFFRIGGQGVPELLSGISPVDRPTPKQLKITVGQGGISEYTEYDPKTGVWTKTGIQAPSTPGENERRAEFLGTFLPFAEQAFAPFNEKAPGRVGSFLQAVGIRELTSPEIQAMDQAGTFYAEAWLRMTTGAAYNDTEFKNSFRLFVPQPGDSARLLKLKVESRAMLRVALNSARGRAAFVSTQGGMSIEDVIGVERHKALQAAVDNAPGSTAREGEDELDAAFRDIGR